MLTEMMVAVIIPWTPTCILNAVLAEGFSLYSLMHYCWRLFNNFISLKTLEVLLHV